MQAIGATGRSSTPAALPVRAIAPPGVGWLALVVLVVSLIPYLCGYLLSPPQRVFLGALNNVGDLSQYLAAIRQGASGAWRYSNQFTPDHAQPLIMYTPYLLGGHLALGLPPTAVFQVLRLICAAACLAALARFCRMFVGPRSLRVAWLFVLLASGLYWLALLLSPLGLSVVPPSSLTAPELSPLLTMLISPHESLGLAAELMGFVCFLRAVGAGEPLWSPERPAAQAAADNRGRALAGAALSFLILALSYPFLLPTVGLTLLACVAIKARGARHTRPIAATRKRDLRPADIFLAEVRMLLLALAPAALIGLYYLHIFRQDALWSHSGLTAVGRPDLGVLLFAFGPLALGAWAGARRLFSWRAAGDSVPFAWAGFPLIWAIVNVCMLVLPIWQQGRQALGLSVPLALLSFLALARTRRTGNHARISLPALPAAALAFSSTLLLALYTAVTAGGVNPNYYAPRDVMQAVDWLGAHAGAGDVVLASAGFSNLVPETCSCRVVVGQNFETFNWAARQREVHSFFGAGSRTAARAVLRALVQREHVTYYVVGPFERALGHVDLADLPGFRLRYRNHDTSIFARIDSRT